MPDAHTSSGARFCLPDLGEGLTSAEIVAWHVAPGDHVVADQPLVTVETDKAVVEIPAPHAGRISTLEAEIGDLIAVGAALVTFMEDGATPVSQTTTVVGELAEAAGEVQTDHATQSVVKASPRARQRARELQVSLPEVIPTGPDNVIQTVDVEAAATTSPRLKGVRRAMAERMTQADARVVRATVTGEADISQWSAGTHHVHRLIRAIGKACTDQPLLNARFDDEKLQLTLQPQVNLGIAMETADGLFVPVLRDVAGVEPLELQARLEALEQGVVQRSIPAQALRGQTITLSNFGTVGGLHAEMVVVPPQVSIVGAGQTFERVVLVDNLPTEHAFLPLSITFDHRVVTGSEACEFLTALIRNLELAE